MSSSSDSGHRPQRREQRPGTKGETGRGDAKAKATDRLPKRGGARPATSGTKVAGGPTRRRPAGPPDAEAPGAPSGPMRIAKAMARAGLCSRRDAERWIADGRVKVNGRILTSPALDVGPDDTVIVDGKPLPGAEAIRLWRYHKPKGLVTTHKDPEGRATVFERLPREIGRVISVGRLDVTSEGLLLLTNDGALARHLELPSTGWLRRYRVRAHGRITPEALKKLEQGITVEGVEYGPIEATLDKEQGANVWLTLGLREGKNREVRKVLGALGLDVNRLIRISYGPFQLLDLAPGAVEAVKRRVIAEQLGPRLARELGLTEAADENRARRQKGREVRRPGGKGGSETAASDGGGNTGSDGDDDA